MSSSIVFGVIVIASTYYFKADLLTVISAWGLGVSWIFAPFIAYNISKDIRSDEPKLDELKMNIDERRVVASAGAYALGRKSDELIINISIGQIFRK